MKIYGEIDAINGNKFIGFFRVEDFSNILEKDHDIITS